jgi:hypothetical protein
VKVTASNLATILVVIVLAWLGLKLLGVALKALGLLILIGVAIALYFGARRLIGKSR